MRRTRRRRRGYPGLGWKRLAAEERAWNRHEKRSASTENGWRIRKLQATVDHLPVTGDNVPVVPGMDIVRVIGTYPDFENYIVSGIGIVNGKWVVSCGEFSFVDELSNIYSTEAAAIEAGKEAGDGKAEDKPDQP